jgi:hypothetical protein
MLDLAGLTDPAIQQHQRIADQPDIARAVDSARTPRAHTGQTGELSVASTCVFATATNPSQSRPQQSEE